MIVCGGPNSVIVKVVVQKGCNARPDAVIGQIDHLSHHLGSLLRGIELTVLCGFVCRVEYFDAQSRENLPYKHGI